MPPASPSRLPAIDAVKAIAAQFIVLHHLAIYGPMSETVFPSAEFAVDSLRHYALMAVPAFLVVGGYLAARGLLPKLATLDMRSLPAMLGNRYLRLARPYLLALMCAIACAWLAGRIAPHPDIPAAPNLPQVVAHLLLIHDIVGVNALSAGVWYVAIDFQLYTLLLLLVVATWPLRRQPPAGHERLVVLACAMLVVASLFWLNRNRELDIWAPYFFGAYGLGILVERMAGRMGRNMALLVVAVLTASALFVEWRGRILVAGVTALLLVWSNGGRLAPKWASGTTTQFLSRISYPLFLIHYPVAMLVGALVSRLWPENVAMNAAGLLFTWVASIAAAVLLDRVAETRIQVPIFRSGLAAR